MELDEPVMSNNLERKNLERIESRNRTISKGKNLERKKSRKKNLEKNNLEKKNLENVSLFFDDM